MPHYTTLFYTASVIITTSKYSYTRKPDYHSNSNYGEERINIVITDMKGSEVPSWSWFCCDYAKNPNPVLQTVFTFCVPNTHSTLTSIHAAVGMFAPCGQQSDCTGYDTHA